MLTSCPFSQVILVSTYYNFKGQRPLQLESQSTKAKTNFSEEETNLLISLSSEEEVLFNCRHKESFLGVELHVIFQCRMVKMSCICKSCRRPVVSLSHAKKVYRVNQP